MSQAVLIFGVNGQVGRRLRDQLSGAYDVTALDRTACDFATVDAKKIEIILRAVEPALIINAAAYTAVDLAESHAAEAGRINAQMPALLASIARAHTIPFLHFSTDYVFDGGRGAPYREAAAVHPLSQYGATKLAGEQAVLREGGYVFRLQWVYDTSGKNFFLTMKKLVNERAEVRVIADQLGAPSFAGDVAHAVARAVPMMLSGHVPAGLYHLAARGFTSWHGFACAIAEATRSKARVVPIISEEYPQAAVRPKDTRLDCSALAAYGIALPHWREGLRRALESSDGATDDPS